MALNSTIEAFSLSHAQILDGETTFLDAIATAAAEDDGNRDIQMRRISPAVILLSKDHQVDPSRRSDHNLAQ